MQPNYKHARGLSILQAWNRQIGKNVSHAGRSRSRLHGAMGFQTRGPVVDQLVEVEDLVFVILYHQHQAAGNHAIRLVGFTGSRVQWGVRWGGPFGSKFDKDFSIPPMPKAKGRQVDLEQIELVELGLRLHHSLKRHCNSHRGASRRLRLPNLWAAFEPSETSLSADGPELDAMCRRTGKSSEELLDEHRREHLGLALLPLNWVSHDWQSFVAVFADLVRFPKRQVIRIRRPASDLQGYRGASEFDFYHSRFDRRHVTRRARRQTRRRALSVA